MQRFNFRLQRVLDIKRIYQELREGELRDAQQKLMQEKSNLAVLEEETYRQQINVRELAAGTPALFSLFSNYFTLLFRVKDIQKDRIKKANKEVQARMATLMNAYKEKRVIENLKDRNWYEYLHEVDKEEQSVTDEISGAHHFKEEKESHTE